MLLFKEIELSDKPWVDELLSYSQFKGTEYCFTSLFIWSTLFHTTICRYNDLLLIRSESHNKLEYLYPAGRGNKEDYQNAFAEIIKDSNGHNKTCYIVAITKEVIPNLIEQIDPFGKYPQITSHFIPSRNSFDYIYLTENLVSLSGK